MVGWRAEGSFLREPPAHGGAARGAGGAAAGQDSLPLPHGTCEHLGDSRDTRGCLRSGSSQRAGQVEGNQPQPGVGMVRRARGGEAGPG